MSIIIFVLAGFSTMLAIGGLVAYADTRHIGLLLSSVVSIAFSIMAIIAVEWWPLVVGFGINLGLKAFGLDPGTGRR
jgi:hypothetical protein